MLFRTHILLGFLFWEVLYMFLEIPFFVLGFVLLGSIFVDIDSCRSKIGKKFWFFSWMLKHRGILHSFVAALFLSLIVSLGNLWAGFGFLVGYVSHLLLDCFTKRGVALFWPFKWRVKGFIKSGYWMEDVAFSIILFLNILFAVHKFL